MRYSEIIEAVANRKYPQIPDEVPKYISDLILACWEFAPDISSIFDRAYAGVVTHYANKQIAQRINIPESGIAALSMNPRKVVLTLNFKETF